MKQVSSKRFGFGKDIGIDLGTSSVLACVKGSSTVLQDPSIAAVEKENGKIVTFGLEAEELLLGLPSQLIAIHPLRHGVVADYPLTEHILKECIQKVVSSRFFRPRLYISVSTDITEVEKEAISDAALHAGAKQIFFIKKPLAAALGCGIDITQAEGANGRRHRGRVHRHCRDFPLPDYRVSHS